ncbi:MAG: hypothetical protein A2Y33_11890 [Spirochaetes bacterium GWF1_51_8]|nr:MAG: hypothetical protein A2Y33_11890 [Spirochaetes bacterium GWF1_51_8]
MICHYLHGTYDNGKIELHDKNLPKIKTEVEIVIVEKDIKRGFPSTASIKLDTSKFKFDREEANAR